MAATVLGIQVEERQILPVFDLAQSKPSRRYFTTLHDSQPKALFHFYLRQNKPEARWLSVGSVFLEGLTPAPAGQPTFELRLEPESSGDILLELRDWSSGMRKRLLFPASRLAAGIPPGARSRLADREPPAGRRARRDRASTKRLPEHPGRQPKLRGRPRKVILAVAAFVSAALVVLVLLLITARLSLPPVFQPLLGPNGPVPRQAAHREPAAEVEQASAGRSQSGAQEDTPFGRDDEPRATGAGNVAEALPPGEAETAGSDEDQFGAGQGGESLPYRVHWGDTLSQITERYYGNADLYPLLARENGIPNPHVLIAGMEIRIPPKIDDKERKDSR